MSTRLLRQDFVGGLAILAVAAIAFWLARELPAGARGAMGPGALPKGLALLLGALGAALMIDACLKPGERIQRPSLRGVLFVLGSLVVFGFAVRPLGLAVAGPLAVALSSFAGSEVRWREVALFAGLMTLFCIALFKFALGLPIPLAPWLIGY